MLSKLMRKTFSRRSRGLDGEPSVFHWRDDERFGNFGDALTLLYQERYFDSPSIFRSGTIHLVGSIITENRLVQSRRNGFARGDGLGRGIFWGCGMKDAEALPSALVNSAIFLGARGTLTRDALDLPCNTPLGDTALLLPRFYKPKPSMESKGKVLWVPHVHHPKLTREDIDGPVDHLVRSPAIPNTTEAIEEFIDTIASARFVMANAMHAAVVALAYGVPFAFWEGRYVNVPFKWRDLSSGIGFEMPFVRDFASAERIYKDVRPDRAFASWDPEPLMAVAPYRMRRV